MPKRLRISKGPLLYSSGLHVDTNIEVKEIRGGVNKLVRFYLQEVSGESSPRVLGISLSHPANAQAVETVPCEVVLFSKGDLHISDCTLVILNLKCFSIVPVHCGYHHRTPNMPGPFYLSVWKVRYEVILVAYSVFPLQEDAQWHLLPCRPSSCKDTFYLVKTKK